MQAQIMFEQIPPIYITFLDQITQYSSKSEAHVEIGLYEAPSGMHVCI